MKNIACIILILAYGTAYIAKLSAQVNPGEQINFSNFYNYDKKKAAEPFIYFDNSDVRVIDHKDFDTLSFGEFEKKIKDIKYIPLITKKDIKFFSSIVFYPHNDKIAIHEFSYKPGKCRGYTGIINGENEIKDLESFNINYQPRGRVLDNEAKVFEEYYPMTEREFKLPVADNMSVTMRKFSFYHVYEFAVKGHVELVLHKNQKWGVHKNHRKEFLFSKFLFPSILSDTVYRKLRDSYYTAKYIVKQEKSIWQQADKKLNFDKCNRLQIDSAYTYLTGDFLESDNYVNYSVSYGSKEYNTTYPVSFWYDKRTKKVFTVEPKTQNDSVAISEPIRHIIPKPVEVFGNKYIGVFSNIKELKEALKNPESYDSRYFQNEEIKEMVTKTKNLKAILVIYELE